jgi:hypothetical protein
VRDQFVNRRCRTAILALVLACGLVAGPRAQADKDKPKVDLVSAVGCITRAADNTWMLTNASEPKVTAMANTGQKEIEAARSQALGKNRYRLIGTLDFGSSEELLQNQVRAQFTAKGSENATGQLQDGRKVLVKGLLIKAPNETRLNLTSVQALADSCK